MDARARQRQSVFRYKSYNDCGTAPLAQTQHAAAFISVCLLMSECKLSLIQNVHSSQTSTLPLLTASAAMDRTKVHGKKRKHPLEMSSSVKMSSTFSLPCAEYRNRCYS